jgi:hypothetical protein
MATRADMMWVGYMPGGTLSRRDPRKVAQHFSAGLALCNATRPGRDDRSPLAIDKSNWCQKTSASIVPIGTDPSLHHFPALKCRATFTLSLRDRSPSPIQPFGNHCILLPVRIFFSARRFFHRYARTPTRWSFLVAAALCVPLRLL